MGDKVKEMEAELAEHLSSPAREWVEVMISHLRGECESPIELMMLMAILRHWNSDFAPHFEVFTTTRSYRIEHDTDFGYRLQVLRGSDDPNARYQQPQQGCRWLLEPQKQIGRFRVDFLISHVNVKRDFGPAMFQLVVECDGHDFHEKTKEQARKDKSRDRDLKVAGYEVFRFAGSEIFADSDKCAEQVADYLEGQFYGMFGDGDVSI